MSLHRLRALLLAVAVLGTACAPSAAPAPSPAPAAGSAAYDRFTREFLDWYYADQPLVATRLGLHRHDGRMADVSAEGMARRVRELRAHLARLEAIPRESLRGTDAYFDHRILEYAIRAQLLDIEEVRGWRKDPAWYAQQVASAASSASSREYAPVGERMDSLALRLAAVPALLATARANLSPDDVPELWQRESVGTIRGVSRYLQGDMMAAFRAQGADRADPAVRARFDREMAAAVAALDAYAAWVETSLAGARGDFRLGRDVFERKVRYEEHVDVTADQLRAVNARAIADYQAWVAREAARVDPSRTPEQVMDAITRDHPTAERLIPTARGQLDEIRAFIVERGIVTLPSDGMPTVRETPPYARSGFASMDAPGPFETVSTEAYYNITNVDPAWTEEQKAQHLTYFNHPGLLGITVHEAMPGHFVQLLYRSQIPTEVRKVFGASSVVEGWAHYTEQMMVDEGLGGGAPEVRLGQLRRALQRHARWHAGLEMHAYGASVDDAAKRFEEIAYFAPFPARRETERGAGDPTYLYYALGRMQILKLRDDYRRYLEARGETFSLREFHDRFLRLGLPVALAREALMPGDTAPSL